MSQSIPDRLELKSQSALQVPSGPPSPALSNTSSFISSVSWMAEKTSGELIPLLKNAYTALKDKEKDLVLAAELGKSLLEHNLRLKSSYDSLLHSSTPPITPSTSTDPIAEYELTESSVDSSDEAHTMRFIPSRGTRQAMIEVLERKNTELNAKIEKIMNEKHQLQRSNTKHTRQFENEIDLLKSSLDIATTKIQELEEMNERQKKMEAAAVTNQQSENEQLLVDELYTEIDKVQQEREAICQSKADLESKLAATLKDLGDLKKQFEKFEFTQKDFDQLHEAYERQFAHIEELNSNLEEHRAIFQKLKEKGISIHSIKSTPTSSSCGEESTSSDKNCYKKNTLLSELENEWYKSNKTTPTTVLSEFICSSPTTTNSEVSSQKTSSYFSRDFQTFAEKTLGVFYNSVPSVGFESVLSKATGIDKSALDDALEFINQIEMQHNQEKAMNLYNTFNDVKEDYEFGMFDYNDDSQLPSSDLYPHPSLSTGLAAVGKKKQNVRQMQHYFNYLEPKTFSGRLRNHVRKLFDLVWKWCRFTIVLTTAILISAWQGPDSILIANN